MKFIVNAISTIKDTFALVINIVSGIFDTLTMVLKYLSAIVGLALETIGTLPSWLKAFGLITIAISIAYFLIGRNTGKSD